MLHLKSKTEFVLNVCLFAELSMWSQDDLRRFVEAIEQITSDNNHETNRIVLCYNPILTICLACEQLSLIGGKVAIFNHQCKTLVEEMQMFAQKIIENLDEANIQAIFMDSDFKNRTVLNLITTYSYVPLMSDEKVSVLLDELWEGKLTYECDGSISYFSKLTFLLTNKVVRLPGRPS